MVLECSSTSWGLDNHVRRKLMLLPVIILAVGLGVASGADPPAMNQTGGSDGSAEPPAMNLTGSSDGSAERSALGSEDELRCSRPLIDVIQGFVVTLASLSVAFFDSSKYVGDGRWARMIGGFLAIIFTPLTDLAANLMRSSMCLLLLWEKWNFRDNARAEKPSSVVVFKRLFKSLLPWKKSLARILASCEIVVYTLAGSPLHTNAELSQKYKMICSDGGSYVQDEKEALIVGTRIEENELSQNLYIRSEMVGYRGALLLMQAKVLPDFDQLKFLRGRSGFAMILIAVQALGYIYAVVYRSATDLRVTPLEVMGLVLNIGLLINVCTFSTCNPCHRPLVIYVNHELDDQLVQFLSKRETKDLQSAQELPEEVGFLSLIGILSLIGLVLIGVVTYYIVSLEAVSKLSVVIPLILFSVAVFVNITFLVTKIMMCSRDRVLESAAIVVYLNVFVIYLNIMLSAVVYVWATVVTVIYWESENFNTRARPNLSDLIPFIG